MNTIDVYQNKMTFKNPVESALTQKTGEGGVPDLSDFPCTARPFAPPSGPLSVSCLLARAGEYASLVRQTVHSQGGPPMATAVWEPTIKSAATKLIINNKWVDAA